MDSAWNNFVTIFEGLLNVHAPWKSMSVPINSPEWVTHEFVSECKARDHFNIFAKRSKNPLHKLEAKRIRNKVNQIAKNMKRVYFMEQIKQAGTDSKKIWRVIKQLLRTGKRRVNITELNGKVDPTEIADEFNQFFCDIGPNLASKIPESLLNLNFEHQDNCPEFNFEPVSESQVQRIFKKISSAKATGCDGIPVKFLKCNLRVTIPILTFIINLSLTTLKVPQGWKKAEVIPLFKEGNKSDPSNFRPISVLPAASKILEKCVHKQVYSYLSECNILSKAQFGFRKAHSTTTCILNLLDYLYNCMDNGKMVGVVFLDLKKAFDTVNHDIMLLKLSKYGLSINAVEWFSSYLKGRVQTVKINGKISRELPTKCGVPQGSVLGPLLFILYINDLEEYLVDSRIGLYADDTALYCTGDSIEDIMLTLQDEIGIVGHWLRANRLSLNVKKTKFVIFGTPYRTSRLPNLKLTIFGEEIEQVEVMKYLGVMLDNNLNFSAHIEHLGKKATQKLGAIAKVRKCINRSTTLMLYKSMVLPHFDYCDVVYMNTSIQNLNRLQSIQNSACRIILLADKETRISDMHRDLKLEMLSTRRQIHLNTFNHKNVYVETETTISSMYIPLSRISNRNTRQGTTMCMRVPAVRTCVGQKAISYIGPCSWNQLPQDARLISDHDSFKKYLKEFMMILFENHPT